MSGHKWYRGGLKFECTGCGDCCTGSPGFVWVEEDEIAAIADHMKMDKDTFEKFYVRRVGARRSLKELPQANYDCVFLDEERRCSIYEVRPRQCRTWPFWDSNLQTPRDWEYACEVCPGSGSGKLYSVEQIESQRKAVDV